MKRTLLTLPLLALALASCTANITVARPTLTPVTVAENGSTALTVYPLFFETNWRDSDGDSYVCDDRATTFTYGFRFDGSLASWTYELDGRETDGPVNTVTVAAPGAGVTRYGPTNEYFTHSFQVAAGMSPRSVKARPASIVIVPKDPKLVGSVFLRLTFKTTNGNTVSFRFPSIPVVQNCG
ncbi:MAG TPA: hypothetical protein VNT60_02100 [Deinococcales bacterium]|nr:hypothetical protein [Deinococcales bacterium]